MAKRMKSKIQPATKTMFFDVRAAAGTGQYIDLSQCASLVNRRFYRQGLNWAVAGFTLHTAADVSGTVTISKAQDTWVVSNAWHKSFAIWTDMNKQVLDVLPSIKGKYHDFKVALDADHVSAGSPVFSANLLPFTQDSAGTPTEYAYGADGEWERSLIEIPNDSEPVLLMVMLL